MSLMGTPPRVIRVATYLATRCLFTVLKNMYKLCISRKKVPMNQCNCLFEFDGNVLIMHTDPMIVNEIQAVFAAACSETQKYSMNKK